MRYRVTVLTPLLVGDGRALAPIDYMIWRDQVNVLDQDRIFKLLSRGPRLDSYLTQLRRAEKLDFANWGGFAQNYAGRRIPFEHASSSAVWQQAPADQLFIPTFAAGPGGPYLPASAVKGALRTGWLFSRWNDSVLREVANRMESDRGLRRLGAAAESMSAGSSASDPMRLLSFGDSDPVARDAFRVYLSRTGMLVARADKRFELGWKQAGRGTAAGNKPELGTPAFFEMAAPGTVFSGRFGVSDYLRSNEVAKVLHWRGKPDARQFFAGANEMATHVLQAHAQFAEAAQLPELTASVSALQSELDAVRGRTDACLLSLGQGGGLLSKAPVPPSATEEYRRILRLLPYYSQAARTGMPFPKSRRIVFTGNRPAALPGWVRLELAAAG